MSDHKHLVFAILRFLQEQGNAGYLSPDALESLEVAAQCLESAFEVSLGDDSAALKYALPAPLPDLFAAGLSQLGTHGTQAAAQAMPNFSKPPEASPEDKLKAESHKAEGNELMKQEKFPEALECYTRAIDLDRGNAVYFCNRAAAHSKLNNHQEALDDCIYALEIDPNYSKAYGRKGMAGNIENPLLLAVRNQDLSAVLSCLSTQKCKVTDDVESPILEACRHGYLEILDAIMGHVIKEYIPIEVTNLIDAAPVEHQMNVVKLLLKHYSKADSRRMSPPDLPLSCYQRTDLMRLIVEAGFDLTKRRERGPLLYAVWKGNKQMVELLLELGMDINWRSSMGDVALRTAVNYGDQDMLTYLLAQGARIDDLDLLKEVGDNETGPTSVLHDAVSLCSLETVQLLLNHGAPVNGISRWQNWPPLFLAFHHGCEMPVMTDIVKSLLDKGADVSIRAEWIYASDSGCQESSIFNVLPLWEACNSLWHLDPEVIHLMLKAGASCHVDDHEIYLTGSFLGGRRRQAPGKYWGYGQKDSSDDMWYDHGKTPLMCAVAKALDGAPIIGELASLSQNINYMDEGGNTAFRCALYNEKFASAKILFSHGLDISADTLWRDQTTFIGQIVASDKEQGMLEFCRKMTSVPHKLLDLCRLQVRHSINGDLVGAYERLPLPLTMIQILRYG